MSSKLNTPLVDKFEIVVAGNRLKFNQGVDPDGTPLKQLLLVTENRELVEVNLKYSYGSIFNRPSNEQ